MIQDYEPYHGTVFVKLFGSCSSPLSVSVYQNMNGAYAMQYENRRGGLYIKYSAKRLSPWRFTFLREHQIEIDKMNADLGEVFLTLVCWKDGIVVLNYKELKLILDENHEATEWISVARGKRQMYLVKGKDGALDFKIGQSDFPRKVLDYFYGVNPSSSGMVAESINLQATA